LINYKKILIKSLHLEYFQGLYLANFPDCERREWSKVLQLMQNEKRFHVVTASENNQVLGFVSYWTFETFSYIEHLAVDKLCRGRGTGSELVKLLAAPGQPILLEVDPPVNELSCKRIKFYERLGLVLHDEFKYVQPPYSPGKPSVPMLLMTSPSMTHEDINKAITTLRVVVYQQPE